MANARPGGPRRPDLDYYEYKRLREQRRVQETPPSPKPAAAKPSEPAAPAASPWQEPALSPASPAPAPARSEHRDQPKAAPRAVEQPVEAEARTAREDEAPEDKRPLLDGVKALMKGVVRRVPEDEPLDLGEEPGEPSAPEEAPIELPEDEDEDAEDARDDAPQIDNPIGDAFNKVRGLFHLARNRLAERRQAGAQSGEDAPEEAAAARLTEALGAGDVEPVLSRRMRRAQAQKEQEAEAEQPEPPILDIGAVDAREVDDLVSKPGTTVRAEFAEEPETAESGDDDDDDDAPVARGTKLFGFFRRRSPAPEPVPAEEPIEPAQPGGEDLSMDSRQQAALTQRLSEELESTPSLSRKERKALAAGVKTRAAIPAPAPVQPAPVPPAPIAVQPAPTPVQPAPAQRAAAPVQRAAAPAAPAAAMPFSAPTAQRAAYPVDEPTQEFRPLRARLTKNPPIEPDLVEDEDDDLPLRRAPKPPKEKKRRVYQDEDLEDEAYGDDRYEDYDEDDYDDYDEDEDDERFDHEDVSFGRRLLGFFKGLVVLILILALCVLALRQLEASRVLSLSGLRSAAGPYEAIENFLENILPAPEATPAPEAAPETAAPEGGQAAPEETPAAGIAEAGPTEAGQNLT